MKAEHIYAQALRWVADGKCVEAKRKLAQSWGLRFPHDFTPDVLQQMMNGGAQRHDYEFRIKPRTITLNGREVQAGETVEPAGGTMVFIADPAQDEFHTAIRWRMASCFARWLERGLVHLTKEAAIAHARAMLNIPESAENEIYE